ncbi:EthD family reductase [Pseudophaeobacter flagellatus]|uniref:EthD family reductase n=1 Tax=Pseudophaeobacter flagellatus TaxID=2899119 RepID=UPI001E56EC10|nr:EthD family reductase [Pseudophaeobacter flagellatus]MCD9148230.1 EthD family reductase [Pseudophaeobacter flagellatus]
MSVSLQVIYPISEDTTFDYGYYSQTHMKLVAKHMGPHIDKTLVTKGVAGGPDLPPPFHAIATIIFADQTALAAALKVSGPVMADLPNFTNVQPQILIGDVIG